MSPRLAPRPREAARRRKFAEGFDAFFDQAQKAVELHLLDDADKIQDIAVAALAGDSNAILAAKAIVGTFERLGDRRLPPMLCVACDNHITPEAPGPLILQFPYGAGADSKAVIPSVCCPACGKLERPELKRRLAAMIDRIYWPGVREMNRAHVSPAAGRA